jgi:hypothetical protein
MVWPLQNQLVYGTDMLINYNFVTNIVKQVSFIRSLKK